MSSPGPLIASPYPWVRPGWFLAGLALGLAGLSFIGWLSGRTDYHPQYARIYPAISPETNYCPTLNEMTAIVRQRCRPDQVLVIVGGNSILEGVWQPVSDLWSNHLQELLGDRYCVINFAFRGGSPTDGGAVVAEVLRKEFPRQILIADEAPFNGVSSIAHEPYRYIFWQAYFRGLLETTDARRRAVSEYQWDRDQRHILQESAVSTWMDSALHYRDLWNRVCFQDFCTVPSNLGDYIPAMLTPRREFKDDEPDAYDPAFMSKKYPASVLPTEMGIVRSVTSQFYRRGRDGVWRLSWAKHRELARNYAEVFPKDLIARTLILVSRSSPYYRLRLDADEQVREDLGYHDAVLLWQGAGYPAVEFGRDFTDDDFGDRIHLSTTGGRKLAELVAPQVTAIAAKLSYLK